MATTLLPPQFLSAILGTNISFADWVQQYTSLIATSGLGIAAQQGVTAALPEIQPLSLAYPGGMVIDVGGSPSAPQYALTQGILAAAQAVQAYTVPANSTGSVRNDAICIAPGQLQVATVSRLVEDNSGNKTPTNIPIVISDIVFSYVAGPSGGGAPVIPAGYDQLCTIAVPNSASSIGSGNVTIDLPTMNPRGPQGPQGPAGTNGANGANGHGSTTTTANIVGGFGPGSVLTFGVADATAYPVDTFGYVIGPIDGNAFIFQVTSVSGNALTVVSLALIFGTSTNTILAGATVCFAGPPYQATVTAPFTYPAVGASVTVSIANSATLQEGSFGYAIGPLSDNIFAFVVTATFATGQAVTIKNLGAYAGTPGSTVIAGSALIPSGPPVISEVNQATQTVTYIKSNSEAFASAGPQSAVVTFNQPFTSLSTYQISLGARGASFAPYITSKTASGFTINTPSGTPANCNVDWTAVGY